MNITDLKKKALNTCRGKWKGLVGITFIYLLLISSVEFTSNNEEISMYFGVGAFVATIAVEFIFTKCLMYLRNSKEKIRFRDTKFTLSMIWNSIKNNLWIMVFLLPIFIVTFLFVIFTVFSFGYMEGVGGIYYSVDTVELSWLILMFIFLLVVMIYGIWINLTYGLTIFLIAENGQCYNTMRLMKECKTLVKGYKLKLLLLQLSFIGWAILAVLTLGIGFLWLIPYMKLTTMEFYYELKDIKKLEKLEVLKNNI